MIEGSLARRYAKALLELASESGSVDLIGRQLDELVTLCQRDNALILGIMSNPGFTPSERRGVLEAMLPKLNLAPLFHNFIRLLLDKNRFLALPDIAREYRALADALANRVRATVTLSAPVSAVFQSRIKAELAAATGREIVLETRIDPSLLGGMVARVGDRVFDASLRTRLETLQLALATTALG